MTGTSVRRHIREREQTEPIFINRLLMIKSLNISMNIAAKDACPFPQAGPRLSVCVGHHLNQRIRRVFVNRASIDCTIRLVCSRFLGLRRMGSEGSELFFRNFSVSLTRTPASDRRNTDAHTQKAPAGPTDDRSDDGLADGRTDQRTERSLTTARPTDPPPPRQARPPHWNASRRGTHATRPDRPDERANERRRDRNVSTERKNQRTLANASVNERANNRPTDGRTNGRTNETNDGRWRDDGRTAGPH